MTTTIQINNLNPKTAKRIVQLCNEYELTADVKRGNIRVDARSIMGVMGLIGHDVDIVIFDEMSSDIMNMIDELRQCE